MSTWLSTALLFWIYSGCLYGVLNRCVLYAMFHCALLTYIRQVLYLNFPDLKIGWLGAAVRIILHRRVDTLAWLGNIYGVHTPNRSFLTQKKNHRTPSCFIDTMSSFSKLVRIFSVILKWLRGCSLTVLYRWNSTPRPINLIKINPIVLLLCLQVLSLI